MFKFLVKYCRFIFVILLLTSISQSNAGQKNKPSKPDLQQKIPEETKERIKKNIINYIAKLNLMEAKFSQKQPTGTEFTGTMYIARPDCVVIDYDQKNNNIVIIGKPKEIIYHDRELQERGSMEQNSPLLQTLLLNNNHSEVIISEIKIIGDNLLATVFIDGVAEDAAHLYFSNISSNPKLIKIETKSENDKIISVNIRSEWTPIKLKNVCKIKTFLKKK